MIMVEALVQQLATARASECPAGPGPSDLREKLVQTDHTELSQVNTHSVYSCFCLWSSLDVVRSVNGLFVFYVDNNAQRPLLGGSETDW